MDDTESALVELFGPSQSDAATLEASRSSRAPQPARDETDELLERVIAEEVATLRTAFVGGAEFAVTGKDSARDRVLHRLECSVLETHLDRRALWTDRRRTRLAADPRFRLMLPALVTRASAQQLTDVRSCRVCWPNVHGNEPHPLRAMKASGLRAAHVDHVLCTARGDSLGTIVRMSTRSGADGDGRRKAIVEVVTSWHTLEYAPSELVYIWDLPTDGEALERKMRLFARLGSGLSPAS